MSADSSELVIFLDDPVTPDSSVRGAQMPMDAPVQQTWRVLIVDDDADVHHATEFALNGLQILDRPIHFLHAYSSIEAIDLLMHEADIAVILLDVVMEKEDAGLAAVSVIRRDLGLINTQIILRTGQPGYAPELETIRRYDINDYRTKSELSRTKLYTALTASVRAYDQLCCIERSRRALEHVVSASNALISGSLDNHFGPTVLARAMAIVGAVTDGLLCVRRQTSADQSGEVIVSAASGYLADYQGRRLAEIDVANLSLAVTKCLELRRTLIDSDAVTMFFPGRNRADFVAYIVLKPHAMYVDRQMVEVFCSNVAVCRENIELVKSLSEFAFVDSLTGLGSRRAFIRAIDERLVESARESIVIALLDVDQFAETNDMFGHPYGDRLLKAIAGRLQQGLEPNCSIARIAGDTFAVLGNPSQVRPETLRPLFLAPFEFDGEERMVSLTMAFVAADQTSGSGADLLKDGSIVIKRAKAAGLGRFATYSPQIGLETRERSQVLNDLSIAFKENQLFLVFQPQIALSDGHVVGVEALLRWQKPDGKFVPPDRFIPIAETSGLIVPIGQWVLTSALKAGKQMAAAGYPGIRMAVNVSTPQFRQPDFLERIDSALVESGLSAASLELEITESVAIMGVDHVAAQLAGLRERGIAVAIDDFGTGYSSLSYLDRLPADRLKIDRAFVWALDSEKPGARIVEMVIPLGRHLKMKVLAEGVENEQQAEILRNCGCDEAQGYLFARPMPFDDLMNWLRERD